MDRVNQNVGNPRCDCHECTQARYNMSFERQIYGEIRIPGDLYFKPIPETPIPEPQDSLNRVQTSEPTQDCGNESKREI